MSSNIETNQPLSAVDSVTVENGLGKPAHELNNESQSCEPEDGTSVPSNSLTAPADSLPEPNNTLTPVPSNPNNTLINNNGINFNQLPALSASTLNSIPVNWLPKNPLYTQKVETDPSIEPNQTLYIKNLNDRVNTKVMENTLRELFSGYTILDIILMKSFWRRGQAWVVFSTIESAAKAMFEFNGYLLYGHAIHINYALEKSNLVSKMNGTYVPTDSKGVKMKPRRIRQRELLYYHSNPTMMAPNTNTMGMIPGMSVDPSIGGAGGYPGPNMVSDMPGFDPVPMGSFSAVDAMSGYGNFSSGMPANMGPAYPGGGMGVGHPGPSPNVVGTMSNTIPMMGSDLERAIMLAQQKANELSFRNQNVVNKILFVENLPENVTNLDVVNLFNKMPGFVEARVIAPRRVAFIDFDSENSSSYALQGSVDKWSIN